MLWRLHIDRTCRASSAFPTANPSGIARSRKARCNAAMSTKSRQTIYGGGIIGAKIRAQGAREAAQKAMREADRAEAEGVVDPDGSLWRAPAAPAHPPPTAQRREQLGPTARGPTLWDPAART